jgi:hypothetical protein
MRDKPRRFHLPSREIAASVPSSLTGEEITLELVKGKMKAVSGSSHANFPTLLSEEFPTAPKITGSEADFSADMLASKLARVVHAQSIDASGSFCAESALNSNRICST